MTGQRIAMGVRAYVRESWRRVAVGALVCWLVITVTQGPGVIVTGQEEAEGPAFSDPGILDILSHVHRRQACPSRVQRYVWRWETYKGERVQHVFLLPGNEVPFLADDGTVILSMSAPLGLPDPEHGGWKMRTNSVEQCPPLPSWLSQWIGGSLWASLTRGPDVPVNFVGAPHAPETP